jgi:hypothetical protein
MTGVAHPDPSEWPRKRKRFLREIGLKTWAEYMDGARLVTVFADNGRISITPQRNLGPKEGFAEISEKAIEVDETLSSAALGDSILRGLALAE